MAGRWTDLSDILGKVIDILIAALIIFIIPASYFMMKKDVISQVGMEKETATFCENVAAQSYLTKDMYERYLNNLDTSGKKYKVSLIHRQWVYEPEYIIRSSSEIIEEDESIWEGVNEYEEVAVETDPPHIEDPIEGEDQLNKETNESILEKSKDLMADPNHAHGDECYKGTKHIHSPRGGSCYRWNSHVHSENCYEYIYHKHSSACRHSHTFNCYSFYPCNGSPIYSHSGPGNAGSRICPDCGKTHMDSFSDFYICNDCGAGMGRITYKPAIYCCGRQLKRGETTSDSRRSLCVARKQILTCGRNTSDNYCGKTTDTIDDKVLTCTRTGSYSLNCGKTEGEYYNGSKRVYEACGKIVKNITPTHPNQTVYINGELITTVRATYVDGSEKTVVAETEFLTSNLATNKSVILLYTVIVDGVTITKSCTINVTIIPKNDTCSNGHIYNLNVDGSESICPYCAGLLKSLSIQEPEDGKLRLYRNPNASLEEEGLVLRAEYLDGHVDLVYSGYKDNLVPTYVGLQRVTIGYKGFFTSLDVEILRNKGQCNKCFLYYDLYMDNKDPGCPYCRARVPIFTGHIMKYYRDIHEDEILKKLYEGEGIYYFNRGDNFEVYTESNEGHIRYGFNDFIKDELVREEEMVKK